MMWGSFSIAKFIIACCPYGGPIALIRNDRKIIALQSQQIRPVLNLYTSAGKLIHQVQWDSTRVVTLGWTADERVVCVLESGLIRIYDLFGDSMQVSMGDVARDFG